MATTAGIAALAALALAGCGSGDDVARTSTTSPAAFVTAVGDLVQPAERMAVLATAVLENDADQPQQVEISGLSDRLEREYRHFGELRLGDPSLAAEQKRLLARMGPIMTTARQVRAGIEASGHAGLKESTATLVSQLEGIQSAG